MAMGLCELFAGCGKGCHPAGSKMTGEKLLSGVSVTVQAKKQLNRAG